MTPVGTPVRGARRELGGVGGRFLFALGVTPRRGSDSCRTKTL